MSAKVHLAAARQGLEQAGVASPRLDAELLLAHAMGVERGHLLLDTGQAVEAAALERFNAYIARRESREPVSHIIGEREFWSLPFYVSSDVLDPRPDSETLVEAALDAMGGRAGGSVLDLGTGSGCLLIAVLHELPDAKGLGVDISRGALEMARRNAGRNGVEGRAEFRAGGWESALGARYDLIISNPPYIPARALEDLEPEVREFEPRGALDGGPDGLEAYRQLLPLLPSLLEDAGAAILEFGQGQGDAVEQLALAAGLAVADRRRDLGGIERCIILKHR